MNLSFIGAGYVGLVSSAMFASLGHRVICVDNDVVKISALLSGILPIHEPGLEKYIAEAVRSKCLDFTHEYNMQHCDAVFIAVGTPSLPSGAVNLSFVYNTVLQVAQNYNPTTLIVIKSTVPPGTCKALTQMLRDKGYMHEVASNPEFLREGNAIYDFLNPDRVVIGVSSVRAENILRAVYKPLSIMHTLNVSSADACDVQRNSIPTFVDTTESREIKILSTDYATSELIKYASNAFLATKVAFINEMANLCEKTDADVETLSIGLGLDHRIGSAFLKAGPGFGGSCFPKDILALSHIAKEYNQPCHVIDAVIFSNQQRREHMVSKISEVLGSLSGKTICALGITFKADTDDVRSSPAVDIINIMISQNANLKVYDPEGEDNGRALVPGALFSASSYDAAKDVDCCVILTEWKEFAELDFKRLGQVMKRKVMFDFRNILSEDTLRLEGFEYYSVGR